MDQVSREFEDCYHIDGKSHRMRCVEWKNARCTAVCNLLAG